MVLSKLTAFTPRFEPIAMKALLFVGCSVLMAVSACSGDANEPATVLELRGETALFCTGRGMETLEIADGLEGELADGDDVWIELEAGVVISVESRSSGSTATCTRSETNGPGEPSTHITPIPVPTNP